MLREDQIDLRRARAAGLVVAKVDARTRLFGQYRVTNPASGGDYSVSLRGYETGDNACTCPDFKANTLGTCKHIEAVLAQLERPAGSARRKAAVTRPEVGLHYGAAVTLALRLPTRSSDALNKLARKYFDSQGHWSAGERYEEFVAAVEDVPEHVTIEPDALDFIDAVVDRHKLAETEVSLIAALDRGKTLPELDGLVRATLYDYQWRGVVFAACRARVILGDDMGLGKTAQAIAAAELLARLRGITRVLVVAPASVKYQWADEIARLSGRTVQVIDGDRPDRLIQYQQPAFFNLVNYEQVTRDLDEINATRPDYVIVDEAQRIKNWESKTSRAVKKLASRYALVLTGTPLENKLEELYSIVQFVDDRRLGPAFQFLHDHRKLDARGNLTGYRKLDAVREKLAPIFLRRTRAEVLTQLPERTESTVYVELAPEQRTPYEQQRATLARLLMKLSLSDLDRRRVLACLTNMRMICDAAALFDDSLDASPKLDEFEALIRDLMSEGEGHKAIVFSQWEQMLHLAGARLEKAKVGYAMLHGRMPSAERAGPIRRFVEDPQCRVFLSTDAGGSGLNLQAADTVIHLEVPWNPAVLEQRIARAHRLGQRRAVHVIRLVARNTIEDRVLEVLAQKRELFDQLFDGDTDEVAFSAPGFAEVVRATAELDEVEPPVVASPPVDKILTAGVALLEALAESLAERGGQIEPGLAERARRAAELVTAALGPPAE
ncbi:MAG: DEAD/DEAH box helicase [Gemmataceae bacterium]|nr:DEAD/DEAH box helicase [Gemmataceae bacterium]